MKGSKRKPFEQHSLRWQREAKRDGIDSHRWNLWNRLSPKSRRDTDPRKYAAGQSVAAQRLSQKQAAAETRLLRVMTQEGRPSTIKRGIRAMTSAQLNKVIGYPTDPGLHGYVQKKARQSVPSGQINPFWYR